MSEELLNIIQIEMNKLLLSSIKGVVISLVIYYIVGRIMRFFRVNFDFSFGRCGGNLLYGIPMILFTLHDIGLI